jgi:hypothetical protein
MEISNFQENFGPVTCIFLGQIIGTQSSRNGRQPSGEEETQDIVVEEALVQQFYLYIGNPFAKAKSGGVARTFETVCPGKHLKGSETTEGFTSTTVIQNPTRSQRVAESATPPR